MHSVLSDLRETVPAVVGIPDSSAVVGRFFRVSIPTDLIASNGEIVQVRNAVPQGSFSVLFSQEVELVTPLIGWAVGHEGCCEGALRFCKAMGEAFF